MHKGSGGHSHSGSFSKFGGSSSGHYTPHVPFGRDPRTWTPWWLSQGPNYPRPVIYPIQYQYPVQYTVPYTTATIITDPISTGSCTTFTATCNSGPSCSVSWQKSDGTLETQTMKSGTALSISSPSFVHVPKFTSGTGTIKSVTSNGACL